MDKLQACLILGHNLNLLTNSEEILDAVEEAVFKEVTFSMRRPFLPILATKCIKKLQEIDLAARTLSLKCILVVNESGEENLVDQVDLLSLLSIYHSHESELKSKLVNTINPLQAVVFYNQWINLFESFAQYFVRIFQELKVDSSLVNQNDIHISESIEFNDLYSEIKELRYNNLVCREYYRLQKLININK